MSHCDTPWSVKVAEKLSITTFAVRAGVSRRTVHRYIADGKLTPNREQGGRPYFLVEDVAVFLRMLDGDNND